MNGSYINHKIPEDILTRFTDKFWKAFANEMNKSLGYDAFIECSESPKKNFYYIAGTAVWVKAFMKTCIDSGLNDVFDYYCTLDQPYDSDIFDDEIYSLLMKNLEKEK